MYISNISLLIVWNGRQTNQVEIKYEQVPLFKCYSFLTVKNFKVFVVCIIYAYIFLVYVV